MRLDDLTCNLPDAQIEGDREVDIRGLAYDSRRVRKGDLFCTWKGRDRDGHQFVPDAVAAGALAVVVEEPLAVEGATVVRVASGRSALADLAAEFYNHPGKEVRVVGITGTNGKTSTAFLLHSLLEGSDVPSGLIGTVGYQVGGEFKPSDRTTPESVDIQYLLREMADEGCRAVVMEVSSHALDQERVRGIPFEVALFTQLSRDHLDYHGTMENYFDAKARLFDGLGADCTAVINAGVESGRRMAERVPGRARLVTYGVEVEADHEARDVECDREGSRFIWSGPHGRIPVQTRWLGRFNVENTLAAMVGAHAMGLEPDEIAAHVADAPQVPGRLEPVPSRHDFCVLVDYAHTPEALARVLETLKPLTEGSLRVLIGCGGDRDRGKRPEMARAACSGADAVIFTSDNPRSEDPRAILNEMTGGLDAGAAFEQEPDRAEAIRKLVASGQPGDILLIAGKGHEDYQEVNGERHPFSDRERAIACLEELK